VRVTVPGIHKLLSGNHYSVNFMLKKKQKKKLHDFPNLCGFLSSVEHNMRNVLFVQLFVMVNVDFKLQNYLNRII